MTHRGASEAAAGLQLRPHASSRAPAQDANAASRLARLIPAGWRRPAAKLTLLATLVTTLSWVGSSSSVFGWRVPSPSSAAGSGMLGSMQPPGALAWPVADGGTGPADAATAAEAAELPRAPGVLPDGRVVLNTATEQELTKLPKVGPKRAAAIVALRQRMGRLRSVRDLLRVKGVGVRTLQRITPLVVLDPPVQAASDGGK